jgi:galactokinase
VPEEWAFVVAHSLEAAEKSGSARAAYNERRADVEEAVRRVATCLGGSPAAASCRALVESHSSAELLEAAERLPDRLRRRFRHVVTEAARVEEAVAALEAGRRDPFGAAMAASHASLREDFDVSTPALDELVAAAMAAGATGARLTGAGLGGCVVALVPRRGAADLLAELSERFYRPRGASTGGASLDSPLAFIVSASGPASASRA